MYCSDALIMKLNCGPAIVAETHLTANIIPAPYCGDISMREIILLLFYERPGALFVIYDLYNYTHATCEWFNLLGKELEFLHIENIIHQSQF